MRRLSFQGWSLLAAALLLAPVAGVAGELAHGERGIVATVHPLAADAAIVIEAALALYRRAWLNSGEYFEAATKYMALADKASRTVALLSERIDQHRARGQQQIIVKHVTVNADQAVVTDQVVTGTSATNQSCLLPCCRRRPGSQCRPSTR